MADPALAAGGATVFPATGRLGEPTPDVVAGDARRPGGRRRSRSACRRPGRSSRSTTAPVTAIAETQFRRRSTRAIELVAGSVDIEAGDAIIIGQTVSFPVDAIGRAGRRPRSRRPQGDDPRQAGRRGEGDPRAVRPGRAEVSPDWTGSVPGFESRVTLTVDQAVQIETPSPSTRSDAATDRDADPAREPQPMTRLLGIDLGERRIGLALADDDGRPPDRFHPAARPRYRGRRDRAGRRHRIAGRRCARRRAAARGIGRRGPAGTLTRDWGEAIRDRLDLPVTFRDERLSSHLAEDRLGPMKRGRSGGPPSKTQRDAYRARVDREAAAIILQDELDTRAGLRSSMAGRPDPQETSR